MGAMSGTATEAQRRRRLKRRCAIACARAGAAALLLALWATPAHASPAEDVATPDSGTAAAVDRFADQPIGGARSGGAASRSQEAAPPAGPSAQRVLVSLGAVALLIVALGWAYRRLFAAQHKNGGSAGVTLVSRSMLTPRHQVLVVRAGHRLLVVGDSGHGMNVLCQVTEPAEVAAILGEAAGEGSRELQAAVFGAALDEAAGAYGEESSEGRGTHPIPGADDGEAPEQPPALSEAAQGEVRSLIERVRSLAKQVGTSGAAPARAAAED